jgi:HSP20 family molecular chaperone IbpA
MTFRKPNPELYPNHPDADILDCVSHYIIEVEVPGIKDVSKLKIQWLDNTTLIVKGETEQAKQPAPTENEDKKEDNKNHAKEQSRACEWPYLVIGERRLGPFERRFTFPVQTVEQDNVKAKLEAGLLTLKVPKHHLHLSKRNKTVEIEAGE